MNEFIQIGTAGDLQLELERRGKGPPLLLLSGEEALEREAPFLDELARDYEVIIPSPPGFGRSTRPDWITSPDDIAYVYLDLVDELGLRGVPVIGCSLGGWIAAEMATKDDAFISKLVLVDPYGIKIGEPTERDIAGHLAPASRTRCWRSSGSTSPRASATTRRCPEDALDDRRAQYRDLRALLLGALHAQSQAQAPAAPHQGADAADLGRERRHRHARVRRGLPQR